MYVATILSHSSCLFKKSFLLNNQNQRQHFKLERWSEYGPMIAAAFASKNQNDVYCLRRIMCEMIERSPQRKKKSGYNSSATHGYDSDAQSVRSKFDLFSLSCFPKLLFTFYAESNHCLNVRCIFKT